MKFIYEGIFCLTAHVDQVQSAILAIRDFNQFQSFNLFDPSFDETIEEFPVFPAVQKNLYFWLICSLVALQFMSHSSAAKDAQSHQAHDGRTALPRTGSAANILTQTPYLQSALQSILDRITAVARRRHPSTASITWTLKIEADPEINASVHITDPKRSASTTPTNHNDEVSIHTGMIDFFLGEAKTEAELQAGLEMIAGVIAHEIGHSIDYSQRQRDFTESQLAEVWADGEAVPLLRDAGIPTNSLYRALSRILRQSHSEDNALRAAAIAFLNTHPTSHFRDIQGEVAVTLDRFNHGATETTPIAASMPQIMSELQQLSTAAQASSAPNPRYTQPQNIAETMQAIRDSLERVRTASTQTDFTTHTNPRAQEELVFNHLLMHLDEQIHQAGPNISEPESRAILNFIVEMQKPSKELRDNLIPAAPTSAKDLNGFPAHPQSHMEHLSRSAFYRSPAYENFLRGQLRPYFESLLWAEPSPRWLTRENLPFKNLLNRFCPPDTFVRLLRETVSAAQHDPRYSAASVGGFLARVQNHIELHEFDIPLARFQQEMLNGLNESARNDFIFNFDYATHNAQNYRNQPFLLRIGATSRTLEPANPSIRIAQTSQLHTQGLRWALDHGHAEDIHFIAQSIWQNRGFYAAHDLIWDSKEDMDWHLIFKSVGLSDEEGRRQLNDGLREYFRSPGYAEFVTALNEDDVADRLLLARQEFRRDLEGTRHQWLDGDIWRHILGDQNPHFSRRLRFNAEINIAAQLLRELPSTHRIAYERFVFPDLKNFLAEQNGSLTSIQLREFFEKIRQRHFGSLKSNALLYDLQIQAIRDLNLPPDVTRSLLTELYLNPGDPSGLPGRRPQGPAGNEMEVANWAVQSEDGHNLRIYHALRDVGAVGKASEFIAALPTYPNLQANTTTNRRHYLLVNDLAEDLLLEMDHIRDPAALAEFTHRIFHVTEVYVPKKGGMEIEPGISSSTTAIKNLTAAVLRRANELNISHEQAYELFLDLTRYGHSFETDQYFENVIRPHRFPSITKQNSEELWQLISDPNAEGYSTKSPEPHHPRRISSGRIRAEIAREILEIDISQRLTPTSHDPHPLEEMQRNGNLPRTMNRFLARIKEMTEPGSLRDGLIESLAWRFNIQDPKIITSLENAKSTNWQFVDAKQIRQGSAITMLAENLEGQSLHDAIGYFMKPQGHLPTSIVEATTRAMTKRHSARVAQALAHNPQFQQEIGNVINELEVAANSSGAVERIPALMLLLRADRNASISDPAFQRHILRTYLGTTAESPDERGFLAYLKIAPPEEVSLALAYRMAMHHEASGLRWRPMFEVFTAVGIKAGQMAGIFRLLGPEATQELRGLENNAQALTLHQITEIFNQTLSPQERARIKRPLRILGSASMKSVVLVELADGTQAVAMVQRPHAAAQIKENLRRARDFIAELRRTGFAVPSLMDQIVDGTEQQMTDELRMTHEAQNISKMQKVYDQLNTSMRDELRGWRFEVPGPIQGFAPRDHLLFTQYANGTHLRGLKNAQDRAHVSRMITQASVRGLLRHGQFNPDPHGGNYIIDPVARIIRPIDFGQLETYNVTPVRDFVTKNLRGDDAYNLAQFLRAVESRNLESIMRFGHRLTSDNAVSANRALDARVREDIQKLLATNPSADDLLIGITDTFSKHAIHMDHRFSFGALKGLLILHQNENLNSGDFTEILRNEIIWVLNSRRSNTVIDEVVGAGQRLGECLARSLKARLNN